MNQNESTKLTQQIQSCILALGMIPELDNLQINSCHGRMPTSLRLHALTKYTALTSILKRPL